MKYLIVIITILLLAVSAWAGMDCKCVDGKKQCTLNNSDITTIEPNDCEGTYLGEMFDKDFKCDRTTEYKKAVFLVSYDISDEFVTGYKDGKYLTKVVHKMITEAVGYTSREYCKNPQFVHVSLKNEFLDSNKKPFPKDYIIWDYREVEK